MSFRLSSLRFWFGVAALAWGGLLVCSAQTGGKERGRAIEFSEPRNDEVTTNLHQLTNKKDSLRQLEEDLYQPLQSFSSKGSLEGVAAPLPPGPPAGPVIQSKRARELLERRKNWEFMRPEDLMAEPTVEEILQAPQYDAEGRRKEDLEPIERYYQRLAGKRPGGKSPNPAKDDDDLFGSPGKAKPRDEIASQDDSNLPSGLRETAQALKQLSKSDISGDPFARGSVRGDSSDIFGLGDNMPSKEQMADHQKLMNEYHSIVDPSWHPPAVTDLANPAAGLTDAGQAQRNAAAGLAGSSSPAPHTGLAAQWDVLNPLLGPAGLPDVNAQALGQSRPAPPLPAVGTPTVAAPSFTAPKRTF
jgi:hypothetical protein